MGVNLSRFTLGREDLAVVALSPEQASSLLLELVSQAGNAGKYRGLGPTSDIAEVRAVATETNAMHLGIRSPSAKAASVETLLGMVQIFGRNLLHGTAQVGAIIDERLHGHGWPIQGVAKAAEAAFRYYPLRRLYFEVAEYSTPMLPKSLARVMDGPVIMPEHQYFDGRYWDVSIYWLSREGAYRGNEATSDSATSWLRTDNAAAFYSSLSSFFGIPAMAPDDYSPLVERGLDSLAMLEVIVAVEAHRGIEIPAEAITELTTAQDLYQWVSATGT